MLMNIFLPSPLRDTKSPRRMYDIVICFFNIREPIVTYALIETNESEKSRSSTLSIKPLRNNLLINYSKVSNCVKLKWNCKAE